MSHFVGKTNTAEDEKDCWQTPLDLFHRIYDEFNFDLDVCASDDNALCGMYFTAERSALEYDWVAKNAFMNPPYSKTKAFIKRAAEQAKAGNVTVVALVNANTDTTWFKEAYKTANEIRLITGRIGFIKPDGKKASGNTKGQCLIIWRGICSTPCQITLIDRS